MVASYSAFGLAAEAHDDVGRERDPGHGVADPGEALEVVLHGVLAAHPAEHRVAARLDRQMKRLAHRWALGHGLDQAIGQIPRVRGHEAQPGDRRNTVAGADPVDGPDELGEIGPALAILVPADRSRGADVREPRLGLEVVAVAVDVLAQQRDLAVARGGQRARLGDDLVERTAPLRPAAVRDDAVGARLVAAVDDRQPGADRRLPADRAAGDRVRSRAHQVRRVRDGRALDHGGRRGRTPAPRPAPAPMRAPGDR